MARRKYRLPDGTVTDTIPQGYTVMPPGIQAANNQQKFKTKPAAWLIPLGAVALKSALKKHPEFAQDFKNNLVSAGKQGFNFLKEILGFGKTNLADAAASSSASLSSAVAPAVSASSPGVGMDTVAIADQVLPENAGLMSSEGSGLYTPVGDSLGGETGGWFSSLSPTTQGILGALGLAGGAYGLAKDWGKRTPLSGALSGLSMGAGAGALASSLGASTLSSALLGPYGLIAAPIIGALLGNIKSGKHEENRRRSKFRDALTKSGFAERGIEGADNPNGTYVPYIGKDGEIAYFDISGEGKESEALDPYGYNVTKSEAPWVGAVNPLAHILTGGDKKLASDFAGYLSSLPAASSDPRGTLKMLYERAGLDHDTAFQALTQLEQEGKISKDEHLAYNNALNEIFDDSREISKGPNIDAVIAGAPDDNEALIRAMHGAGVSPISVSSDRTSVLSDTTPVTKDVSQMTGGSTSPLIHQEEPDAATQILNSVLTNPQTVDPRGHTAGEIFGGAGGSSVLPSDATPYPSFIDAQGHQKPQIISSSVALQQEKPQYARTLEDRIRLLRALNAGA